MQIVRQRQPLEVTMLSESLPPIAGYLAERDGPMIQIILKEKIAFGAPVRVEIDGVGDVFHREKTADGFRTGITARHRMETFTELTNLSRALAEPQGTAEIVPAETHS